ncbi:LCP family protein [Cumulibacter soli]|uniref:LCP family protein n=1 Tax=Cumulibacter soli TaxID=2546344 RepID=UPI00106800FB|nr:LCP family protein [Cumulibacter soli]
MTHPEDQDRTRELPAYLDPRGVDQPTERYRGAAYDPRVDHHRPAADQPTQVYPPAAQQPPAQRSPYQPAAQPPGAYPPGGSPTGGDDVPPRKRKRRGWKIFGSVVLVLVVAIAGFVIYLDTSLNREDILADYDGRPADTPGVTWLLVGSDSREDLTDEQKDELATGDAEGKRTDTIMLLHIPDSDAPPSLISLPRDTLTDIPDYGQQKLNAAFAFGGGSLLAQSVEGLTGLRIDRYAEIGFGGFAGIVDAVGGVEMCLDEPMNDPLAGLDLEAGCQTLNGSQALGYVRTRASANADLDRVQRQREFLSALLSEAASFGTLINPFTSVPLALEVADTLIVDDDVHLWHLASMGLAMGSGDLVTTTVPVAATPTLPEVGSVVQWDDAAATAMFDAIRADEAIPSELITTE